MSADAVFDRADLDQRLAVAKPTDTVLGMFFAGVVKSIEGRGRKGLAAELRARHGAEGWHDFKGYPAAAFLRLVFDAVEAGIAEGTPRKQAVH